MKTRIPTVMIIRCERQIEQPRARRFDGRWVKDGPLQVSFTKAVFRSPEHVARGIAAMRANAPLLARVQVKRTWWAVKVLVSAYVYMTHEVQFELEAIDSPVKVQRRRRVQGSLQGSGVAPRRIVSRSVRRKSGKRA